VAACVGCSRASGTFDLRQDEEVPVASGSLEGYSSLRALEWRLVRRSEGNLCSILLAREGRRAGSSHSDGHTDGPYGVHVQRKCPPEAAAVFVEWKGRRIGQSERKPDIALFLTGDFTSHAAR
jgi:hypothetical protein